MKESRAEGVYAPSARGTMQAQAQQQEPEQGEIMNNSTATTYRARRQADRYRLFMILLIAGIAAMAFHALDNVTSSVSAQRTRTAAVQTVADATSAPSNMLAGVAGGLTTAGTQRAMEQNLAVSESLSGARCAYVFHATPGTYGDFELKCTEGHAPSAADHKALSAAEAASGMACHLEYHSEDGGWFEPICGAQQG